MYYLYSDSQKYSSGYSYTKYYFIGKDCHRVWIQSQFVEGCLKKTTYSEKISEKDILSLKDIVRNNKRYNIDI